MKKKWNAYDYYSAIARNWFLELEYESALKFNLYKASYLRFYVIRFDEVSDNKNNLFLVKLRGI